jgi:hypothetical protein
VAVLEDLEVGLSGAEVQVIAVASGPIGLCGGTVT